MEGGEKDNTAQTNGTSLVTDTLKDAIDRYHAGKLLSDSDRTSELRQLLVRFLDACRLMEKAHSLGVIHVDLKPEHIIRRSGKTVVTNWGFASSIGGDVSDFRSEEEGVLAHKSGWVGTPAYMSPELAYAEWERLNRTSDVYGLGATLYYLLTGKTPFPDDELVSTMTKVIEGTITLPRTHDPNIPASLESICLKAMEYEQSSRYPTCQALGDAVERYLASEE
jgi:serine/threonine protein kinase